MLIPRTRRGLATAVATAGALIAAVVIPAAPAAAYVPGAPPCYGSTCIGDDPYISSHGASCVYGYDGANAAYDVVTVGLAGYSSDTSVTLRYSPLCGANWARWNGGTDNITYWVKTKTDGRIAKGTSGQAPNYTTMLDGTQLAQVCLYSPFDDTQNCSGWY